ncbi:response regulator [Nocardioides sp. LS1]|uniref:response regulator n=1 Tax=Nocardioides sp. LS1 TaxID=1027620 RepID=UPI000F621DD7|nr:response regulator [Nocardioides sp. LS1]GCD91047.1 hypothetical protein NLS1_30530 [Nocardioides sp. LS1]
MTDSDNAADAGTTAPQPDAAVHKTDAVQTGRALRVLVADDVDIVRELLRRMLEKLGHVVDEVTDGQQAVEAVSAGNYDLLLLDLSMPRMSGIDVARWLNAHPEHARDMNVVIVSASARDERPILNELGISLFLPKPIRRQELADLLDGLPN